MAKGHLFIRLKLTFRAKMVTELFAFWGIWELDHKNFKAIVLCSASFSFNM